MFNAAPDPDADDLDDPLPLPIIFTLSNPADPPLLLSNAAKFSLDPNPPPRLLGLHCATVAVRLLESMYERYDDCYTPRSMIRSFHVSQIKLEEETCMELAFNLQHNKRLLHLSVEDGGLSTAKAMAALARALKSNTSLHWMMLEGHAHISELYSISGGSGGKSERNESGGGVGRSTTTTATTKPILPIVGPLSELIDYNKARSCRAEIAEPVMLRALSIPNNGLDQFDLQKILSFF